MHTRLKSFHKEFINIKNVNPRTKANEELKEKALYDAGDLYYKQYYIYKDKYNYKISSLNTDDRRNFDYKKLRLTDDYEYESENEKEQ